MSCQQQISRCVLPLRMLKALDIVLMLTLHIPKSHRKPLHR